MKLLIKLAIVALVVHALVRFSVPYWHHHQFEFALKARMLDWRESSDESILAEVFSLATSNNVPIDREQVVLRREEDRLLLTIAYTRSIELIPTVPRRWDFGISLSGRVVRAPGSQR